MRATIAPLMLCQLALYDLCYHFTVGTGQGSLDGFYKEPHVLFFCFPAVGLFGLVEGTNDIFFRSGFGQKGLQYVYLRLLSVS